MKKKVPSGSPSVTSTLPYIGTSCCTPKDLGTAEFIHTSIFLANFKFGVYVSRLLG
jgi:hypothetical protein